MIEYFHGIDLKTFLSSNTATLGEKMIIVDQLLEILHYLHSKNVVHRDLNVKNVLINTQTNQLKLIDFGLSRAYSGIECLSPIEGSISYRPPSLLCDEWGFSDMWGVFLIFFSLKEKEHFSSKRIVHFLFQNDNESEISLLKLKEFFRFLIKKEEKGKLSHKDLDITLLR